MKKNPKKPTSVNLTEEQENYLKSHPLGRTEVIKNSIILFSEVDWELIKKKAKELGITPGRLIDVALFQFEKLSEEEKYQAIIDYLKVMRDNPSDRVNK